MERPDGASYLYFQRFSLQIGKDYQLVEGLAHSVRTLLICATFDKRDLETRDVML